MSGPLSAAALRPLLRTASLGRSVEVHEVVDSTMDEARRAAELGAPDGHLVLAEAQRAGRGRQGSRWDSPPGEDLYLTLVLRRLPPPPELPLLGLGAALALCECAEALGIATARVKWPNDLLLDGRKAAGVLLESYAEPGGGPIALLGIGVDVGRRRWPEALRPLATSFSEAAGRPVDRLALLAELLGRLERWRERLRGAVGRAELVARLEERLAWLGEPVRCDGLRGELLGLEPDGALRLRTAEGERTCRSGTLRRLDG